MKGELTARSKRRGRHQLQNHSRGKIASPSALGRVRPLREQRELEKDQGTKRPGNVLEKGTTRSPVVFWRLMWEEKVLSKDVKVKRVLRKGHVGKF